MLEFKNVSVALGHGKASAPFSMVMSEGELGCLCAPSGSGKTTLLKAIMGMAPVVSGYITIAGEPVSPASAAYLRKMTAYVPRRLPDVQLRVSELCQSVFGIRANRDAAPTRETLLEVWRQLEVDESLYGAQANQARPPHAQLIMLSMLPLLRRPIILIDDLLQNETVYRFLKKLTVDGAEILYTCEENMMPCDKLVKL